MKAKEYLGLLLGAVYGVLIRLLMSPSEYAGKDLYDVFNIYSVAFIWVVPIGIGIIPIIIAKNEIMTSRLKQFVLPLLSVLLFFIVTLTMGIEDWLCILIIAFPFLIAAGFTGLVAAYIIKRKNKNKLLSLVFLPILIAPIENLFDNHTTLYQTESQIMISAKDTLVWSYLIEVPEIKDSEYQKGLLQFIGVPRPIKSELITIDEEAHRVGYFSEGLALYETLSEVDVYRTVSFDVHIDKSVLRDTPTDRHILKSNNFSFHDITYRIDSIAPGKTILNLKCTYEINSKMNWYAQFWADIIIADFEQRLLMALKYKIENSGTPMTLRTNH